MGLWFLRKKGDNRVRIFKLSLRAEPVGVTALAYDPIYEKAETGGSKIQGFLRLQRERVQGQLGHATETRP